MNSRIVMLLTANSGRIAQLIARGVGYVLAATAGALKISPTVGQTEAIIAGAGALAAWGIDIAIHRLRKVAEAEAKKEQP